MEKAFLNRGSKVGRGGIGFRLVGLIACSLARDTINYSAFTVFDDSPFTIHCFSKALHPFRKKYQEVWKRAI
jgi:hypothetical protein